MTGTHFHKKVKRQRNIMGVVIDKEVNPAFENYIFEWQYKFQLIFGGYGSSKSYNTGLKIILKCLKEVRKVLVVRAVYETMRDSCFDLLVEILDDLGLLDKVKVVGNPMGIRFPNGSRIIFKGMDKPAKLKSINGISIIWVEEASEIKYEGFKELVGRLRHPTLSNHIILTWNPVDESNWTYKQFFIDEENENTIIDPEIVYREKVIAKGNKYYHHSVPTDNLYLTKDYLNELQAIKEYDPDLYRTAWLGRYGIKGQKVLPQLTRLGYKDVADQIKFIPESMKFTGMDFGFEKSYNAVVRMAVDDDNKILYIYDEYYKNKMTDSETAVELKELGYDKELIFADCAEPKAIKYYNLCGFNMAKCHKGTSGKTGSRLNNVRKIKRFKSIVVSSSCINTWKELKDLTYKMDANGNVKYDEFNIDPHTFSAIWYGLDTYEVADLKHQYHSRK